jgi:polyisoprenoid-binding protein YceI
MRMADLSKLTPGKWQIDTTHSSVAFSVRHLMISKVKGTFKDFSGTIVIDDDPLKSTVDARVGLASVDTGDEQRDAHLKGSDFFDTETYPDMVFTSTGLRHDDGDYLLDGELSILGVTKPVTFELEFEGVSADPWGNTKAGFSAKTEINRKDWGMNYNAALETGGVLIGEKAKIELDIEAAKV